MTYDDKLFSLKGKTAIVTGATGHLGQAMAFGLAAAGAHVLINGRNIERVTNCVERLVASGYSADALVFDVTDDKEVTEKLLSISEQPLHILVNNAYTGGTGSLQTTESDQYRNSYDVSLISAHTLLRSALPALRKAVKQDGDASIINIASMYAIVSPDLRIYESPSTANPPFYGAAKAALVQWTRYAACELGPDRVRVNCISPGPFPDDTTQRTSAEFIARLSNKVPLGRIGTASEIQGPVLFLASAASSFVTGINLIVDGGWTAW